jgi:hypothetical protein
LDNAGDTIELKFPNRPELDGSVPYILGEKVAYLPLSPWPAAAAGAGQSLQRGALLAYSNDPTNWFAAAPTAGGLSSQTSQDMDGDGLPDTWEMANHTDPFVADGLLDPDGDGFSNYEEWLAGTDPYDGASYLKIEAKHTADPGIILRFDAVADRSYSILTAPTPQGAWLVLTNIAAAADYRVISLPQPATGAAFYRLVVPARP